MRKIITITQVTVDGVMQAPGGSEEDRKDGFTQGGWAMPLVDEALNIVETVGEYDMLLGRWTYDIFAGYWPYQDNAIAKAFDRATKYVVTHRSDQLDWETSVRIGGDVVEEVRWLKASDGPESHIWGSSELLQTLIAADLIDEYPCLLEIACGLDRRGAFHQHNSNDAIAIDRDPFRSGLLGGADRASDVCLCNLGRTPRHYTSPIV